MIKAKRINSKIVCFINGKIYERDFTTDERILEVYEQLMNVDEDNEVEIKEIIDIFKPKVSEEEQKVLDDIEKIEKEAEDNAELMQWVDDIRTEGHDIFEVNGFNFYIKGINITVPEFLINRFYERRESVEDTSSLLNFWRLCSLNSDPRCREDLYKFLESSNMAVTPSGYFVAYRNVRVKEQGNQTFNEFVIDQYNKIKRKWKKKPSNYHIVEITDIEDEYNIEYRLEKIKKFVYKENEKVLGTLVELYDKVTSDGYSEGTTYTDAHTGTFEIKIGEMVTMDRKKCDANPENTCSNGLHLGNEMFMRNNGGSFGNVGVMCLCNPMDVVAVPRSYDGKLRCCAYLPISMSEYGENGELKPVDTATFEHEYAEYTQDKLEELVQGNTGLEELKQHEILPKELTIQSLRDILKKNKVSLDEMNLAIKDKVQKV